MKSSNKQTGARGEELACNFLEKNGYKILERNKHFSRACEIDIIAQYKSTVVFVEVKTRSTNNFGTPFEAITQTKYNHMKNGAFQYLSENNKFKNFRIDVIGITLEPNLEIKHLQNVSI